MFFGLDPLYFVFLAPALMLSAWASWKVHHAYAEAREIGASSGYSGAQAAEAIVARYGLDAGADRGGRWLPLGSL